MSLVYDVGMFNGDDTAYYLKKEFRVVGIEANPHLIPQLIERFSTDIEQKRLGSRTSLWPRSKERSSCSSLAAISRKAR